MAPTNLLVDGHRPLSTNGWLEASPVFRAAAWTVSSISSNTRILPATRANTAEGAPTDMTKSAPAKGDSPSRLIDARIKELGDWRGKTLARVRALIGQADPEVVEEWKWRGVPVWSHDGIICTGETYKSVVKLTFAKGASLKDPAGLFNSSLEGNTRRAIDLHESDKMDEAAFKTLIRAAAALNKSSAR